MTPITDSLQAFMTVSSNHKFGSLVLNNNTLRSMNKIYAFFTKRAESLATIYRFKQELRESYGSELGRLSIQYFNKLQGNSKTLHNKTVRQVASYMQRACIILRENKATLENLCKGAYSPFDAAFDAVVHSNSDILERGNFNELKERVLKDINNVVLGSNNILSENKILKMITHREFGSLYDDKKIEKELKHEISEMNFAFDKVMQREINSNVPQGAVMPKKIYDNFKREAIEKIISEAVATHKMKTDEEILDKFDGVVLWKILNYGINYELFTDHEALDSAYINRKININGDVLKENRFASCKGEIDEIKQKIKNDVHRMHNQPTATFLINGEKKVVDMNVLYGNSIEKVTEDLEENIKYIIRNTYKNIGDIAIDDIDMDSDINMNMMKNIFEMFYQSSELILKNLSGILGCGLDEHYGMNRTLSIDGRDVLITHSIPDNDQVALNYTYRVHPDGTVGLDGVHGEALAAGRQHRWIIPPMTKIPEVPRNVTQEQPV